MTENGDWLWVLNRVKRDWEGLWRKGRTLSQNTWEKAT